VSEGVGSWTGLTIGGTYRVGWHNHDYDCGGSFTSQLTAVNFYDVETDIVKSVEFSNGVTLTGELHGLDITPVVEWAVSDTEHDDSCRRAMRVDGLGSIAGPHPGFQCWHSMPDGTREWWQRRPGEPWELLERVEPRPKFYFDVLASLRRSDVSAENPNWTLTVGDTVLPIYDFGRGYYHGGPGALWTSGPGVLDSVTLGIENIPDTVYARLEKSKVVLRGPDGIEFPGRVLVTDSERHPRQPWRAEMRFRPDSWAELRSKLE